METASRSGTGPNHDSAGGDGGGGDGGGAFGLCHVEEVEVWCERQKGVSYMIAFSDGLNVERATARRFSTRDFVGWDIEPPTGPCRIIPPVFFGSRGTPMFPDISVAVDLATTASDATRRASSQRNALSQKQSRSSRLDRRQQVAINAPARIPTHLSSTTMTTTRAFSKSRIPPPPPPSPPPPRTTATPAVRRCIR